VTVQTFPIEDIQLDARCQARAKIDNDAVDDYAAAYERGDDLPPIDVFLVAGKPYVVNGFHRFTAQLKNGVSFLRTTTVGTGTIDDAIWHASRANATNGLRRTNEDKRRAVRLALESAVGSEQSSRVIAEWVGVHHDLVSKVRSEVEGRQLADSASSTPAPAPKRVGKDGKARPATQPKRAAAPTPAVAKGEPTPATESHESDAPRDPGLAESRVELDAEASVLPPFAAPLAQLAKDIAALRLRARKVVADTTVHAQSLERALKDAENAVDGAVPVMCPACVSAGCTKCRSRGWVTRNDAASIDATSKRLAGVPA
jgi:transposase-like protein